MPAPIPESKQKRPTNLSLSPNRLRFAQRYAKAHQTSISMVVDDLIGALEQTLTTKDVTASLDPLDGLLLGWPMFDKGELRQAQHEARLGK